MADRRTSAVLWDVDGVIIDSAEQHRLSWQQLAAERGLPFTDERFWASFGRRNSDVIPQLYGITGSPEELEALAQRKEALYRDLLRVQASALPGARELMAALHAAGYRQALGSSAPEENIRLIVELLDLTSYLGATISGETVAHGKPAPDIFLAGAHALGVAPQRCLVIEDAPAGIAAAHAGGMKCLAVRRAGVADAPGLDQADRVVTTLAEVDVRDVDAMLADNAGHR